MPVPIRERILYELPPPRPIPAVLLLQCMWFSLWKHPRRISPVVLLSGATAYLLQKIRAPSFLWTMWSMVVGCYGGLAAWNMGRQVYRDISLVAYGKVANAQIIRANRCRDATGEPCGTSFDIVVALSNQHFMAGQVWVKNDRDAARLWQQRSIPMIGLPRSPGTWQALDPTVQTALPHQKSRYLSTALPEHDHL